MYIQCVDKSIVWTYTLCIYSAYIVHIDRVSTYRMCFYMYIHILYMSCILYVHIYSVCLDTYVVYVCNILVA